MKKVIVACFLILIAFVVTRARLYTMQQRTYSEIKADYQVQGNMNEKYAYMMSLDKKDFAIFFSNPDFAQGILVPLFNCAASGQGEFEMCQSLLVAILRRTMEQALDYYPVYGKAALTINRPYQLIQVLKDRYSEDPKKMVRALVGLIKAVPALAMIQFNGTTVDFGLVHYVLLKYAAALLKNPVDQTWFPVVPLILHDWLGHADSFAQAKIIDFSANDIVAIAKIDDFENARVKAVHPSPLLTTQGLAQALGLQAMFKA